MVPGQAGPAPGFQALPAAPYGPTYQPNVSGFVPDPAIAQIGPGPGSPGRSKWLLWGGGAFGLILAATILAVVLTSRPSGTGSHTNNGTQNAGNQQAANNTDADTLFQKALENALSTRSFAITMKDTAVGEGSYAVDSSDPQDLRIAGTLRLTGKDFDIKGYGNVKSTYVMFTNADNPAAVPAKYNAWIQVRKDGILIDKSGTGASTYDTLFSPGSLMYWKILFGNFSQADRTEILKYMREKQIFTYDASQVAQAMLNGQAVTQYTVSLSRDNQISLYTKLAGLSDFPKDLIQQNTTRNQLASTDQTKLVISISNSDSRIVQYSEDNRDSLMTFSDFSTAEAGQAPTAQYTWDQAH
jgi:hypothetical protein